MKIRRILDTSNATYDLTGISDKDFRMLFLALQKHYMYIHRTLPTDDGNLYEKMSKILESSVTES